MSHSFSLISTLAIGFAIAWALGFLMERIKVPALVGYLLAGIIISPATPGFVGDVNIASELSEIGVMLLMFGVGLHFSMSDLIRVKNIAVPGAILQMGLATCLGAVLAHFWGWPWGQSIVFGMCLSCASTVVLLKGLESRGILESGDGQIAVGWLVVEDIMTVLILVLLPPLASLLGSPLQNTEASLPLWQIIGITLAQVFGFIILMLVVGKRLLPWLLRQVAKTGSRELFTLSVLVFAIGIAYGAAQIFHVSFALGAFFSGMVMRESRYSHRAAMESLPLRDAFAVIFFVGVGMMFDPKVLYEQPLHVLAVLAIIILGKGLVAFGLVLLFRYTLHTALTVAAALAQIGEFSFILAALGLQLKILPQEGMSLVLAGAIISIALNPFAFATIGPARDFIKKRWAFARRMDARIDPMSLMPDSVCSDILHGHVVLVGYGEKGKIILDELLQRHLSVVVVDDHHAVVEELREKKVNSIYGDATDPAILIQAHIHEAAILVLAIDNEILCRKIVETAKILRPTIETVMPAENEEDAKALKADGVAQAFVPDELLAQAIVQFTMSRFGKESEDQKIREEEAEEQKAIERGAL